MRVLLDEELDLKLRHRFGEEFQAETVEYQGWKGTQNGELIQKAQAAGFGALVTPDQNIPDQQDLSELRLRIVVIVPLSLAIEDIEPLMPGVSEALQAMQPGEVRRVEPPDEVLGEDRPGSLGPEVRVLTRMLAEWEEAGEERSAELRAEIGRRMRALEGYQIGLLRAQVPTEQFDQAVGALTDAAARGAQGGAPESK